MAEYKKNAWDNISEDFGFLLNRPTYDLPEWLQLGIGENEYMPQSGLEQAGGSINMDLIAELQKSDRTRGRVSAIPDPMLSDDEKSGRGFGRTDPMSGLVGPVADMPTGARGVDYGSFEPSPMDYENFQRAGRGVVPTYEEAFIPAPDPVEGPDQGRTPYELGQDFRNLPSDVAEGLGEWVEGKKEQSIERLEKQDRDAVYSPFIEGIKGNADPSMNSFAGQIGGLNTPADSPYWLPPQASVPDKVSPNPFNTADLGGFVGEFDAPAEGIGSSLRPQMRPAGLGTSSGGDPYVKPESTIGDTGSGKSGPIGKSLSDDADDAAKELNWIQRTARDTFGMDEEGRADLARALIQGGAATMMGSSPFAMQNIGAGIMEGANTYYQEGEDRTKEQRAEELLQMKRDEFGLDQELQRMNIQKARAALDKIAAGGRVDPKSPEGKMLDDIEYDARRLGVPIEEMMGVYEKIAAMGKKDNPFAGLTGGS